MKAKLITFADGNLGIKSAARRLVRQGNKSGYFEDGCENWNLRKLSIRDPQFLDKNYDFIMANPKGLGLWIWQPAFLLAALNSSPEGQIVVALDAGCQLVVNEVAKQRMANYLEMVQHKDYLFIQIKENSFGIADLSERAWTKKSCITNFSLPDIFLSQTQIQSGLIFIRNSEETRNFIARWYENCINGEYELLMDPTSDEIQAPNFVSHRYAQSILSLMVKKESLPVLADETYWYPNWNNGLDYPIWSMRNRSGGDAFRRNSFDLAQIGLARVERLLRQLSSKS